MKKTVIYLIISCIFTITIPLKGQQRPGIAKRIQDRKIEFFNEKLQLTPQEKEKFWPVYNDYTNRKNLLNQQRNSLVIYFEQNEKNLDDKEISNSLEKLLDYQRQETSLMELYVKKFKEFLPDSRIIKIFVTELQFKKWLLTQSVQARPNAR